MAAREYKMSILLYVHLKNDVFPTSLPSLSLANAITSLVNFLTAMQKAVTSVSRSWDVGFKTPGTILLIWLYMFSQGINKSNNRLKFSFGHGWGSENIIWVKRPIRAFHSLISVQNFKYIKTLMFFRCHIQLWKIFSW